MLSSRGGWRVVDARRSSPCLGRQIWRESAEELFGDPHCRPFSDVDPVKATIDGLIRGSIRSVGGSNIDPDVGKVLFDQHPADWGVGLLQACYYRPREAVRNQPGFRMNIGPKSSASTEKDLSKQQRVADFNSESALVGRRGLELGQLFGDDRLTDETLNELGNGQ